MKDYYKILGVEENSTDDDIKKAYRNLSKQFHPDVNPQGTERFKEIADAYENIGTKEKREQLKSRQSNPFAGQGFEDMFRDMFGGGGGGGNRYRRPGVPDKVVTVNITPVQSYNGDEITINYFRNKGCDSCSGSGGNREVCSGCGGYGYHSIVSGSGYFRQEVRQVCKTCNGDGFKLNNKCHMCSGSGKKPTTETIRIKVPVGIDDGQFLKLGELGDFHDGIYGNLVIQIKMMNIDGYEKIGNDLILNYYMDIEALKKDSIIIKHPSSDLKMDLPMDFDSSKPLRLKGKGYNGGDMYVRLHVKFDRAKLIQ
jgi:molecular chaperone DnaJ